MNNKIILENELFYCEHLTNRENVIEELSSFSIQKSTGNGLLNYLKNYALDDEYSGEMRTYLVRDKQTQEIVGYFSLKAGMVSINEKRILFHREFDCIPGIELANFAVNDSYRETHKEYAGIGKIIFSYFIYPIVKKVSNQIGVYMLYIFALPYKKLLSYYETLHFQRLTSTEEYYVHKRIKPRYDKDCVFMCQKIN